ncbi:hypothetical protein [Sphaerimonospora mesophila]|uniref:hypothetical protein n=1 Tax=Sphaerimonospora mesophila TaxID=37483 RepID=UPI0006E4013B
MTTMLDQRHHSGMVATLAVYLGRLGDVVEMARHGPQPNRRRPPSVVVVVVPRTSTPCGRSVIASTAASGAALDTAGCSPCSDT